MSTFRIRGLCYLTSSKKQSQTLERHWNEPRTVCLRVSQVNSNQITEPQDLRTVYLALPASRVVDQAEFRALRISHLYIHAPSHVPCHQHLKACILHYQTHSDIHVRNSARSDMVRTDSLGSTNKQTSILFQNVLGPPYCRLRYLRCWLCTCTCMVRGVRVSVRRLSIYQSSRRGREKKGYVCIWMGMGTSLGTGIERLSIGAFFETSCFVCWFVRREMSVYLAIFTT